MLFQTHPHIYFEKDEGAGGASGEAGASNSNVQGNEGNSSGQTETGANTAPAIDWSKIDVSLIPKDIVEKHPVFNKVKEESINRRKELNRLKKALTDDGEGESGNHAADQTADVQQVDESKLSPVERILLQKLNEIEQYQKQQSVDNVWLRVKAENGLEDDDRPFIAGASYDEMSKMAKAYAKRMGRRTPEAETGEAGTSTQFTRNEAFKNRMKQRMTGGGGLSDPFDPGVHKMQGGTY